MRTINPIDEYLAVFPEVRGETVSEGGLILPNSQDEYIEYGRVAACGGRVNEKRQGDEVKVGDLIIFKKIAGPSLVSGGRRIQLIKSDSVIAIIRDEPDPPEANVPAA